MTPIYLDPTHKNFPSEGELPLSQRPLLRAALVRWLWARLDELTGDCVLGLTLPEEGVVEAAFPAMEAGELIHMLSSRGVFCTQGGGKYTLRFTLSAAQRPEDIDTLQAVLMEVLNLS